MVRTKQGGSILGFILIGAVLAALLVGGVYFVRHQIAKQTPSTAVAPTPSQQQSSSDTPESSAPATEDKSSNTDASPKKEEKSADKKSTETNSQPATQTAKELPKTGPSQTIGALIVAGIVSYAVVSYARSRRLNLSF